MKKHRIAAALLAAAMMFAALPAAGLDLAAPAFAATTTSTAKKLDAPKGITAVNTTETSIKLGWKKVAGADAYRVYMYDEDSGKYVVYKSVTSLSCTIKGLTEGTKYKFRVAALVKKNKKFVTQTLSGTVVVKTDSKKTIQAPLRLAAYTSTSEVKVTWKTVAGADAYRVYYATAFGDFQEFNVVYGTECNVIGLKDNRTYRFKVAALVKEGSKYVEASMSSEIRTRTLLIHRYAKRSTPGDFRLPAAGTSGSDAIGYSGMNTVMEYAARCSATESAYMGNVLFNDQPAVAILMFNQDNEFYRAVVYTKCSEYDYADALIDARLRYGQSEMEMAGNVVYDVFTDGDLVVKTSYDKTTGEMTIIYVYEDYAPRMK